MGNWTEGPWIMAGSDEIDGLSFYCIEACNGIGIAEVSGIYDVKKDDFPLTEEALANANLIAAAPEMYEALEAMLSAYCGYSSAEGQQGSAEFDARAALAKALGEPEQKQAPEQP
jgi:hypothetical protein